MNATDIASPTLEPQFSTPEQQRSATVLGMWVFLATEFLLFGGMFAAILAYRVWYRQDFAAAAGGLNVLIGGINTIVLLTSSLTMALAVNAAQTSGRRLVLWLVLTALLGLAFELLKAYEYYTDYRDGLVPGTAAFFARDWPHGDPPADPGHVALMLLFYYIMTGLHALHLSIGIGLVCWQIARAVGGRLTPDRSDVTEAVALYWHFVDLVWIFLLAFLYLSGHHVPSDLHF